MNILFIGFMGSGKSTVGKELAENRGMAFVDLDAELENQEGKSVSRIFREEGEAVFREKESALLKKWAEQQLDNTVVSTGGGIVLSEVNLQLIRNMGRTVWLDVSAKEAHRRTMHEKTRPLADHPDREEVMQKILEKRRSLYGQAQIRVRVDGKSVREIIDEINHRLHDTAQSALRERVLSAIGQLEGKTVRIEPHALCGCVKVPASKSITHRALICAALSRKPCRVKNALVSDDTLATAACLKALGCRFEGDTLEGASLFKTGGMLSCGESGSTLRFLMPLACLAETMNTLDGTGRLLERPVQPLANALNALGGRVETTNGFAPVRTQPGLSGGTCELPGDVSSQFVSALLLALPACPTASQIKIQGALQSRPYVDVTLKTMRHFGVAVHQKDQSFHIQPQAYRANDFAVPSDWSSAAFFLAAGAIGGDVSATGLLPDRQADAAIVDILQKMGASLRVDTAGKTITARASALSGIEVDVSNCPDLVPILAVVACFAKGQTRLYNAARLRLKESDRLSAMAIELRKMGGQVREEPDALLIQGTKLSGALLESHNDHRIAMALSVAAAHASGPSVISGAQSVAKSYPTFYHDFRALEGTA